MSSNNWSFPIFDCFSAPLVSLVTCCCCPCQVVRQRATIKENFGCGQCLFSVFCLPFAACLNRYEVRTKHNIRGTGIGDCVCFGCCCFCSTVQVTRELDHKGDRPGGLFMRTDGNNSKNPHKCIDKDDSISIVNNKYESPNSPTYQSQIEIIDNDNNSASIYKDGGEE